MQGLTGRAPSCVGRKVFPVGGCPGMSGMVLCDSVCGGGWVPPLFGLEIFYFRRFSRVHFGGVITVNSSGAELMRYAAALQRPHRGAAVA
jgi:hypothetical protein